MEKMTNKKALEFVLSLEGVVANVEVYEKLEKMLEQVSKKNASGKSGKPSKVQLENEGVKEEIVNSLDFEPTQIKDMDLVKLGKYSSQKISALMSQLVKEGKVVKVIEKRVALFAKAPIQE